MYKKRMIITVMMAVCFIAACAHKPDSEEQVDIRDAVGDSGHQEKLDGGRRSGKPVQ